MSFVDKIANARSRIGSIISGQDAKFGKSFELATICLIILSSISLVVETVPDLPDWFALLLRIEEATIVMLFSLEYLLRVATTDKPLRYVLSFWGMIDLLAILPFYLSSGIDLRGVRVFRLLRLLRLLKLLRFVKAGQNLKRAFGEVKDELIIFAVMAAAVIYVAAIGIYYFEHLVQPEQFGSIPKALWWSIATLTTVGYGDVYPVTVGGRMFTTFVLAIGLGVVAVPSGLIASALTASRKANSAKEPSDPVS